MWQKRTQICVRICVLDPPSRFAPGGGFFLCLQSDFFTTNLISSLCSGSHLHLCRHHHGVMMNRPSAFVFLSGWAPLVAQSREHSFSKKLAVPKIFATLEVSQAMGKPGRPALPTGSPAVVANRGGPAYTQATRCILHR